jgi:hypothetical protein
MYLFNVPKAWGYLICSGISELPQIRAEFGRPRAPELCRLWSAAQDRPHHLRQTASSWPPQVVAALLAATLVARCVRSGAKLASAAMTGVRKLLAELVDPCQHRFG